VVNPEVPEVGNSYANRYERNIKNSSPPNGKPKSQVYRHRGNENDNKWTETRKYHMEEKTPQALFSTYKYTVPVVNRFLPLAKKYEPQDENREMLQYNSGQLPLCSTIRNHKNPKERRRDRAPSENQCQIAQRNEEESNQIAVNGTTCTKKERVFRLKHKHKIIIVGDSYARNCANEVKQIVGNKCEVTGVVKSGARTEEMVNTVSRDIRKLTNKDMVVVWTGALDVAKNETEKGLHQIKTFVEYYSQTNIIVMSVPHRHDLEYKSCVNDEVERFNRKLRKILKVFKNARVVEVESERDCFTKHGLHMNSRGKEQAEKKSERNFGYIKWKKV
jgi:hypothetical protein